MSQLDELDFPLAIPDAVELDVNFESIQIHPALKRLMERIDLNARWRKLYRSMGIEFAFPGDDDSMWRS